MEWKMENDMETSLQGPNLTEYSVLECILGLTISGNPQLGSTEGIRGKFYP